MNIRHLFILSAVAVAVVDSFVEKTLAQPPAPAPNLSPNVDVSLLNTTAHQMPSCDNPQPNPNNPFSSQAPIDFVVRVVIPNPYQPNRTARSVYMKRPTTGGNEAASDGDGPHPDFGQLMLSSVAGPFHIDLTQQFPSGTTIPAKPISYVEVRVILMDSKLSFIADGFPSIGYSDATDNVNLCGLLATVTGHRHQVRVFFVPMNKPSKNHDGNGSYNIGLDAPGANTPVYIDPKVINNGYSLRR